GSVKTIAAATDIKASPADAMRTIVSKTSLSRCVIEFDSTLSFFIGAFLSCHALVITTLRRRISRPPMLRVTSRPKLVLPRLENLKRAIGIHRPECAGDIRRTHHSRNTAFGVRPVLMERISKSDAGISYCSTVENRSVQEIADRIGAPIKIDSIIHQGP